MTGVLIYTTVDSEMNSTKPGLKCDEREKIGREEGFRKKSIKKSMLFRNRTLNN